VRAQRASPATAASELNKLRQGFHRRPASRINPTCTLALLLLRCTAHHPRSLRRVSTLSPPNHACCRALTPSIRSTRHASAPPLHHRPSTAEQAHHHPRASSKDTPPPARCGAVTHWSPNTLTNPTIAVAASICQFTLTRDPPHCP
jgi:hypothetical protein